MIVRNYRYPMNRGCLAKFVVWRAILVLCSTLVTPQPLNGLAQKRSAISETTLPEGSTLRDGRYEFDFHIGTWKTHLKRLGNPLTGSTTWVDTMAPLSSERFGMAAPIFMSSSPMAPRATSKVLTCVSTSQSHINGVSIR
jgi:hypothetical protein